jgi:DNA helicase-2/ATP-dependent DNA helicase PcrA
MLAMTPSLNPAQAEAVDHQNGPLLVLAGAGSGKTRVITHRIAKLVERGVPARAIVALTFTNKAAGEMRERVASLIGGRRAGARRGQGPKEEGVTVSTFHSFGLGVLTRERAALGGAFTIYDQGDQLGVVKEVLRGIQADKSYDASAILARISNAKNAFAEPGDLPDSGVDEYDEMTKIVYPRYQAALRQFRAFDFDDLVCEVARLWNRRADVLAKWQERFRYVLVDEYQDTNRAQLELLRLLAATHRNVCVVGDDDQSIYAWRGADVRNILDFEEHFPGATVIKLEQNYRSCAPVLDVANAVISKRTDSKYRKTLFTDRRGGEKVVSLTAPSPEAEAVHVARELREMIRGEGRRPRDLAVLYRSNGQAKLVEEALREQGVPYRLVGGTQFFERKEVKDLLSYMKLVVNPRDDISLRRIINYPARGIGETSVERLATHALARDWTLWQAVERVDALDDIAPSAREGCKALEAAVVAAKRALDEQKLPASAVARGLADAAGLREEIVTSSPSNEIAARRWGNVEGLFGTFTRHETSHGEKAAAGLASLLHALTLDLSKEEDEEVDAVTLSTLHGSKGLEFDVVFLIGCEEGYLPHSRTLDTRATDAAPQDIEEERRLFYVGVTRARERLFLSRTRARMLRGKPTPRVASRFLLGVPPELLEEREVKDVSAMSHVETAQAADALLAALAALGS